jgi:1-deoxy-D-xylulose-5-phosphate reductoisomerase
MKRKIAILGSTGSIGTQAIEVIDANLDYFEIEVLTANNNADLLIAQSRKFLPNAVVIANEDKYDYVSSNLEDLPIKVYTGKDSISQVVQIDSVEMVLTAMVGYEGLLPTINAIKAGKHVALANKETLVVAGELITKLALEKNIQILPVDSEHSAIFQCLVGEDNNEIEKIYLTASGGPFRGKTIEFLRNVKKEEALKHPNWDMGAKVTIDSASLMNKGLEAIEAKWLFNLKPDQIDVIVHPQSIIHSIVQFEDGSMKAQMGLPDMKLPIQYALGFPHRIKSDFKRFNFVEYPSLTFEKPDLKIFKNLAIAFEVLKKGGNSACIMNAANEIVVDAFLKEKIGFLDMPEIIEKVIQKVKFIEKPGYEDYVQSDFEARKIALELVIL